MKTKVLVALALMASLVLLTGCGDDDNPVVPSGGGGGNSTIVTGTLTFTFNGVDLDYSEDSVGVEENADWCLLGGHGPGANQAMNLRMPDTVGTYTMGEAGDPYVNFVYDEMAWLLDSGTVTITDAGGDNLVGTFSGTFTNVQNETRTLTQGSFDIPITRAP